MEKFDLHIKTYLTSKEFLDLDGFLKISYWLLSSLGGMKLKCESGTILITKLIQENHPYISDSEIKQPRFAPDDVFRDTPPSSIVWNGLRAQEKSLVYYIFHTTNPLESQGEIVYNLIGYARESNRCRNQFPFYEFEYIWLPHVYNLNAKQINPKENNKENMKTGKKKRKKKNNKNGLQMQQQALGQTSNSSELPLCSSDNISSKLLKPSPPAPPKTASKSQLLDPLKTTKMTPDTGSSNRDRFLPASGTSKKDEGDMHRKESDMSGNAYSEFGQECEEDISQLHDANKDKSVVKQITKKMQQTLLPAGELALQEPCEGDFGHDGAEGKNDKLDKEYVKYNDELDKEDIEKNDGLGKEDVEKRNCETSAVETVSDFSVANEGDIELNWESFEDKYNDSSESEDSDEENMSSWDFVLSDDPVNFKKEVGDPQESVLSFTLRHLRTLQHGCQLGNVKCPVLHCHKLKRKLKHLNGCKQSGCQICTRLAASCIFHAKYCLEPKCPTPYCLKIKLKLRQQQCIANL